LSGQGESDAERALLPLVCLTKKSVRTPGNTIPDSVALHILSFLTPAPKPEMLPAISKGFADARQIIQLRPSINDILKIGTPFSLQVFNAYWGIAQVDNSIRLIEDAKLPHEEGANQEPLAAAQSISQRKANHDWFEFIGNLLAKQQLPFVSIALGAVILLSRIDADVLSVLGAALVTAGVAGLAMHHSSTNGEAENNVAKRACL
jgi:hypothetical protein